MRAARLLVVNEAFVKEFLPGEKSAVGRRIRRAGSRNNEGPWTTIVGVVADVKHYGLERATRPGVYLPLPSQPVATLTVALNDPGRSGGRNGRRGDTSRWLARSIVQLPTWAKGMRPGLASHREETVRTGPLP